MISQRVEGRQIEYQNTLTSLNRTYATYYRNQSKLTDLQVRETSSAHAVSCRYQGLAFRLRNDYGSQRRFNRTNKTKFAKLMQQDLEEQLTFTFHSTALLNAKIRQETEMLDHSKLELDRLGKDARREETLRVKRSRNANYVSGKADTLARKDSLRHKPQSNIRRRGSAICATASTRSKTSNNRTRSNLSQPTLPVLDQLLGHIESIEANHSHTNLIEESIKSTSADLTSLIS